MIKNADITVINEKSGKYYLKHFSNVSFIGKNSKAINEKGLNSADYFTVRIPVSAIDCILADVREWKSASVINSPLTTESGDFLEAENGEALETGGQNIWAFIPNKSYIVRGTIQYSDTVNMQRPLSSYEAYTVVSVSDNRNGYPAVQHIRCDIK